MVPGVTPPQNHKLDLPSHPPDNNVVTRLSKAEARAFVIKPHDPWLYENNADEYRKRFAGGNDELFKCQTQFLDRFLSLAQRQGIRVVIVNMPLTDANMSLMPPGSYARYSAVVQQACATYGADLLDLNQGGSGFTTQDFKDTAHMNAEGGKKFLDKIAQRLAASARLRLALSPGGAGM
jgi:lysophospholipase L1-like esterase